MYVGEISDDYLICLYREKNQDAIDLIFERYRRYIIKIIQNVIKNEIYFCDYEELFQEAMIVFIKCLDYYDEECGCFYFFVKKSIERKIYDELKRVKIESKILSLDTLKYDNGNICYVDCVAEDDEKCKYTSDLYSCLVRKLKECEKVVVDLRLEGYSYVEIAKITNSNKQSVYRKIAKIKNILKDIMEKID